MSIRANLLIDQGADFIATINVEDNNGDPIDLTGYTGLAQIRKHYSSSTHYDFIVTINALAGHITLSMSNTITGSISAGRYVYDCEVTDASGFVTRILHGQVEVTPEVTK